MYKEFNKLSRLVQFILLIIPFVNWVTELVVRWSRFLDKKDTLSLLCALFVTIFGLPLGIVDAIWVLLFNHMLLAD